MSAASDRPITLINVFTVPVGETERFLRRWKESAAIMARQPGMIRARLHQAVSDDAAFRFINVAEWASQAEFEAALATREFRASGQRMAEDPELHVTAAPVVCEVAITVHAGDVPE